MRRAGRRGLSLAEVAVLLAILAILMAVAVPAYFRYRAHTAVNTALEMTEGLLARAREEAKGSGYALSQDLVAGGVSEPADAGRVGADGAVSVRVRKRYRAGEPAQVLTVKDLSTGVAVDVETTGLGKLDIDEDSSQEGVFFEILVKRGADVHLVASIPVEVNGEMILFEDAGGGSIVLGYADYRRSLDVTRRGVITPDRR